MNIKRYLAATAREALAQVRRELGADALILSNQRVNGQIEVIAAGAAAMQTLVEQSRPPRERNAGVEPEAFVDYVRRRNERLESEAATRGGPARAPVALYAEVASAPVDDEPALPAAAAPAGATVVPAQAGTHSGAAPAGRPERSEGPRTAPSTFQNAGPTTLATAEARPSAWSVFRRRPAHITAPVAPAATPAAATTPVAEAPPLQVAPLATHDVVPATDAAIAPAAAAGLVAGDAPAVMAAASPAAAAASLEAPAVASPLAATLAAPAAAAPMLRTDALLESPRERALLAEVQAMRALLEEQLSTLALNDAQRRNPLQARVMTRLLMSGFSPRLAREIAQRLPAGLSADDAERWVVDLLGRNLQCAGAAAGALEHGDGAGANAFALVGPTGVGKTTTVAKLAARFAVRHGASALGLITLDTYRVGAQDQLRTYGRILGAPVHTAADTATLRDLLTGMAAKRLVLVDTCGMSQRDSRRDEVLAMLRACQVRPVLLINAASHAETLDDVARGWKADDCAGAVVTKLDEAARIGGALDCLLRHKLALLGLTNGQRVPEDWHAPVAPVLAHLALKPPGASFELDEGEATLMAHTAPAAATGVLHA